MEHRVRNRIVLLSILGFQPMAIGQSVSLSIASGSGIAGGIVALAVNLTFSGGAQTAAPQWSFSYSSDITSVTVIPGISATSAQKSGAMAAAPTAISITASGIAGIVSLLPGSLAGLSCHALLPTLISVSSNRTSVTVPTNVTVAAGQSSATFTRHHRKRPSASFTATVAASSSDQNVVLFQKAS